MSEDLEGMTRIALGKLLKHILTVDPEASDITLDDEGFAKISELVRGINLTNPETITDQDILDVVEHDRTRRFEREEDRIRAVDSVLSSSNYRPMQPPEFLFACINRRDLPFVLEAGFFSFGNQYTTLYETASCAMEAGRKRKFKKGHIVGIYAREAWEEGTQFFYQKGKFHIRELAPIHLEDRDIRDALDELRDEFDPDYGDY